MMTSGRVTPAAGTLRMTSSSTDSNFPMQLGGPAVTIGGGGPATNAHAITESFDLTNSGKGPHYALLLVVALAQ